MLKVKLNSTTRLYQVDRLLIGLSGGIACGKSTVSNIFKENGFIVIEADKLVKKVYEQDEARGLVRQMVPEVISDGRIDFKKLREKFFLDELLRDRIENFIYPRLRTEFEKEARLQYSTARRNDLIIYDAPVLFEKNLHTQVDYSICVYCPRPIQIQRLKERDGISDKEIKRILSAQIDIEKKKLLASFIFENHQDLANLNQTVLAFIANSLQKE